MTSPSRSSAPEQPRGTAFEWIVIGLAIITFASIKLVAHRRFGTAFDSALFGNVAWRLGMGMDSVSTLTGFQYFATHASGVILMLAPVFAQSPRTGMAVAFVWQAVSVGLIGFAVMQVASSFGLSKRSRRISVLIAVLSPGAFLATRLDVHEPTLGLGFLALTLTSGLANQSIRRHWFWPVLAAACRIEMAVATIVAGLLLVRRNRRQAGLVAVSAGTLGASFSLWFIARSGSEAASVAAHFAHLGSTVNEVLATIVTDPVAVVQPLGEPAMLSSLFLWLLPTGIIIPLLSWRYLSVALPMAGVAIFGVWAPADQFAHHYWYGFLVAAPIAAVETLRQRPHLEKAFVLTGVLGVTIGWVGLLTVMPILQPFGRLETATLSEMVDYVSNNEPLSVSGPDNLLPHLVGRADLFNFPRPFLCEAEEIGPFAWDGNLPDVILIPSSDLASIGDNSVLALLLQRFYDIDGSTDLITPFRLKAPTASSSGCL